MANDDVLKKAIQNLEGCFNSETMASRNIARSTEQLARVVALEEIGHVAEQLLDMLNAVTRDKTHDA
jgi:hypothetical protein